MFIMEKVSKHCRRYSYSKHTISYVEHLCADFSYYYKLYEDLKVDLEEEKIWSFTSKDINTKINLYRPSDTTAESALKLLEKERNRELQQVSTFVKAVVRFYGKLSNESKKWFYTHILDKTNNNKRDKEEKRLRYEMLSNVAHYMGIPEDGSKVRKIDKVGKIAEECLGSV